MLAAMSNLQIRLESLTSILTIFKLVRSSPGLYTHSPILKLVLNICLPDADDDLHGDRIHFSHVPTAEDLPPDVVSLQVGAS